MRNAKPVAVVMNGAAGALLDRADAAVELTTQFTAAGLAPHFVEQDAGNLPERIALATRMGVSVVVVAGGDGTVACAAQALAGSEMTLGILPFGTMNLLAKDLGIPVGDTEAALRVLASGTAREIDVGEVNGRVFLCASMLGLPARLARHREAERASSRLRLWFRFGSAALRGIRRDKKMRLAVGIQERIMRLRVSSLTIAANALDDPSGRMFGRSRLDGGELAMYVIAHLDVGDLARLAWAALRGDWQHTRAIREHRAGEIAIGADRASLRVMNDGEVMLLQPPLHYRIRPRALRVMAPTPGGAA